MSDIQPLEAAEARALGVLVEKSMTTPESYPLSLNALVNGCNQKSNRHPMMSYDSTSVEAAVRDLRMNRLAVEISSTSARVVKFAHKAGERLELDAAPLAVIAELLLRGPQTQGELRQRASRMSPIATLDELRALLDALMARGMVVRLAPAPGSRAPRYGQTLAPGLHGDEEPDAAPPSRPPAASSSGPRPAAPSPPGAVPATPGSAAASSGDVAALSARVAELERQVAELRQRLDARD